MILGKDAYATPYFQAGLSDNSILGECCEPRFSTWDAYGFEILGKPRAIKDAIFSEDGVKPVAFELKDLDYDTLSLFVLSLVWRASVSKLLFFDAVSLGPMEEPIRKLLFSGRPPHPREYSIIFGATLDHKYRATILRPDRYRPPEGINFYRIYLPNLFVLIKADSRDVPYPLSMVMLRPSAWNYIMYFPFKNSPLRALERIPAELRKRRWVGKAGS